MIRAEEQKQAAETLVAAYKKEVEKLQKVAEDHARAETALA